MRDGRWISSHVMNQDFVAWIGQGTIADRTQEHLGTGDRGVILLRQRFLDDLAAIGRGEDPKGVIRDPAANVGVPFTGRRAPIPHREPQPRRASETPVLGKQYAGRVSISGRSARRSAPCLPESNGNLKLMWGGPPGPRRTPPSGSFSGPTVPVRRAYPHHRTIRR